MQGLLDFIKTPEGQGLLSGVFGYAANARKGTPVNNLGRGGLAGLLGYSNALERQDQQAETQFQRQYRQMQMDEMQRKLAEQKGQQEWRAGLPSMLQKQTMVPNDAGPTAAPDTEAINNYLMDPRSPFADELVKRQLFPKEEEAYTLGEGQVRYKGNQVVAQGPAKTPEQPSGVREYEFARTQGYKGSYQDWVLSQKRASAPSVAVNMNDPTAVARAGLSLQKDFRDATKPSFARATAYNSMLEASKNPSPKGDLTMVYSFIKALDPESVVREGEIDLVNANRAIPDRIKGYAQRLATGQSLLPSERQDLLEQARTLSFTDYTRSRNDIQAFRENANRLGLSPELYAPDPYAGVDFGPRRLGAAPTTPGQNTQPAQPKSKPMKGQVVDGYKFKGGDPAEQSNWEPAR